MKKPFLKSFSKNEKKYLSLGLGALLFFLIGYFFAITSSTNILAANTNKTEEKINVNKLLNEVKTIINNNFISWQNDYKAPTQSDLDYGMIKGFVNAYNDPYTQFFTPKESEQFEADLKGSFGGIGAMINYLNKKPVIMSVLKNTPAELSGLKSGDLIISVNDENVESYSIEDVVSLIRGEINTIVNLEVLDNDTKNIKKLSIKRAEIQIPILESEVIDGVYVIHFNSFTQDSGPRFQIELNKFLASNFKYLMIDIRGNGGGYLTSAIDIASFFLEKDKVVVIEKNKKSTGDIIDYSKGYNYFKEHQDRKIAILVDGGSASASEILAGALKDNNVATIIGEKTFGKGSVQELIKLSDNSDIKITVAKWFTPNGINISENGISPDIIATSSLQIKLDNNGKVIDEQLKSAIKLFKNKK